MCTSTVPTSCVYMYLGLVSEGVVRRLGFAAGCSAPLLHEGGLRRGLVYVGARAGCVAAGTCVLVRGVMSARLPFFFLIIEILCAVLTWDNSRCLDVLKSSALCYEKLLQDEKFSRLHPTICIS